MMNNNPIDEKRLDQSITELMRKITNLDDLNMVMEIIRKFYQQDNPDSGDDTNEEKHGEVSAFPEKIYEEFKSDLAPYFTINNPRQEQVQNGLQGDKLLSSESVLDTSMHLMKKQFGKYNYVWCLTNLGYFTGRILFSEVPGLKTALFSSIRNAFDDRTQFIECLNAVYPNLPIQTVHITGIMNDSIRLFARGKEGKENKGQVEEYFVKVLNRIYPARTFSNNTLEAKAVLKIEFLKFLWLHWLESCFADIISLVLCDASAIFACIHDNEFFGFETIGIPPVEKDITEEKFIDEFFGINKAVPIYFRFRFLLSALEYIEQRIGRKNPLENKIRKRIQPVINILLEKKNIKGNALDTYRFQNYAFLFPYFSGGICFSIDIQFVEKMHKFIVKKIFQCMDLFLEKQNRTTAGDWVKELAFRDWELNEVDNLIHKMAAGDNDIPFVQYRHILAAGRYAFELFPRKAMQINRLILSATRHAPAYIKEDQQQETAYIDYYFNREYYWNWHVFNRELEKYLATRENSDFPDAGNSLEKNYRDKERYDKIMADIREKLSALSWEKDAVYIKKLNVMLHHYEAFQEIHQYNIELEKDIEINIYNNNTPQGIIQAVFDHEIFHKILDDLIQTNFIKTVFLDCIEDALLAFSDRNYLEFPIILSDKYYRMFPEKYSYRYFQSSPTTSDHTSLRMLYECGAIFNRERYLRAIDNWYERQGNTRSIHQEAWKGKIMGKIKYCIFRSLEAKIGSETWTKANYRLFSCIDNWCALFEKPNKEIKEIEELNNLSHNLEKHIMEKILSPSETATYEQMIKDAIIKVCSETLLWIHYKNVRYIYKKLVKP